MACIAAPIDAPGITIGRGRERRVELNQIIGQVTGRLGDLASTAEGYVSDISAGPGQPIFGRLAVYQNGVIEWGDTSGSYGEEYKTILPSAGMFSGVREMLELIPALHRDANYFGRVRIWFTVERAEQLQFAVDQRRYYTPETVTPRRRIEAVEDTNVEALAADPIPVLRGLMDHLWAAYGWERCMLFDAQGEPTVPRW